MKTNNHFRKLLTITLVLILVLQGCRVYKHKESSLQEAVTEQKRVKIKTTDGKTLKYKRVYKEDGQYFGTKKVYGVMESEPIDSEKIENVRLHNQALSIIYGIVVGTVAVYATTIGLVLASLGL